MRRSDAALVALAAALAGCAGKPPRAEPPTLATLLGREAAISADPGIRTSEEQAIAAYQRFLQTTPRAGEHAPWRSEAMRRLGDLELERADNAATPDYRAAIARYRERLAQFPRADGNDRVLYQLARAQEQAGDLDGALATLDRLVREHADSAAIVEAQFRRGELLFSNKDYVKAEAAYTRVLAGDGALRERALYMQGWSRFKQGRLEEALGSFFGVLDVALAEAGDAPLEDVEGLSRADRELVEDTLRVASISLANLSGAASIPAFIDSDARRGYEHRVYRHLGELYVKQERSKDAADTFAAFAKARPLHAQAPQLQARVIEIYQGGGFRSLALEAKREYVVRYGAGSEFRQANEAGWQRAQPLVQLHLVELARHHHALAQKARSRADADEAIKWYRELLGSFPEDAQAAEHNFLLAELLHEQQRFAEAAVEYERAAYAYPAHAKSADAGYAALLARAEQTKRAAAADAPALRLAQVDSAQRFAAAFPGDARVAPVLADAAEKLYVAGKGGDAARVAQQVLARADAKPAERRVAATVIAHAAFDAGDWARAEGAYAELMPLVPERERSELVERQAAAIYKQAEAARKAGDGRAALGHFNRVAERAPGSAVRANAQYDAAAAAIELKDWEAAAHTLEDFRQRFAQHPLQPEVDRKLAAIYLEQQQWSKAAGELERIAAGGGDAQLARDALWQAAQLHEKAQATSAAARVYERMLQAPAGHAPDRVAEARWRLAKLARDSGNRARESALLNELVQADAAAGAARTPRQRTLAALAALALAEPVVAEYRKVALVEPLARSLKAKKARLEDALRTYAAAAEYGVPEVTTAATFHTAALYQDFGRSLLGSQRPKKLSKAEREQYDVLLEEQAFPFEEKATELHEANARRAADGLWDEWVRKSYAALRELRPLRYAKNERVEEGIDAR